MMKKILLTGGGTAGHVTPNIALIPELQKAGYKVYYMGSKNGIERQLIASEHIPYYGIASGKLRRYFSWQNFIDPFKVLLGTFQAYRHLGDLKPDVIFSKGGYVVVPVILAAYLRKIPIVIHESDFTPGLANRLAMPFAAKICTTFKTTATLIKNNKGVWTGTPIRKELLEGSAKEGRHFTGLDKSKPIILVTGGSLGAKAINDVVREALPVILKDFQVIHLCGKGNLDPSFKHTKGYCQYEYVQAELPHLLAAADLVVSRAGSNTLSELLALDKPNILIPLPASQSRGDQILNANSFKTSGYSYVLEQENFTAETLIQAINSTYENRSVYQIAMEKSPAAHGIHKIIHVIQQIN